LFSIDVEVAICSFVMLTDSQAGDEWTSRYVCRGGEFFDVDLTRMGDFIRCDRENQCRRRLYVFHPQRERCVRTTGEITVAEKERFQWQAN